MTGKTYLNVTRGTVLQTLCQEIMSKLQQGEDVTPLSRWVTDEQRNLRKKQSLLWEPTVSDKCYYHYLEMIRKALNEHRENSWFAQLLTEIRKITRSKIYALFLTQEVACWPSLASLFDAARNNPDFEAALVYTPFFHENFTQEADHYSEYQSMGLPVLRHNAYELSAHSPDIVFMIKPYGNTPEQFQIKHLECVIPRAVYIPYGMEITTDLAKFGFRYYLHYKAWRHCAYGDIVKEFACKCGYRNGENVAVWGHPKADNYRDAEANRASIPQEWKEIIGDRKTILWTPHHLIDLSGDGTGTWLIWGEQILNLALKTPEVVFIFRPHPLLMGALANSGAMSQTKIDRLRQRIESAENMIWDTHSLYHHAFNAADAIISDGTTFCVEFLYTKKPILLTPRNMTGFYQYERMLESYYIAREMSDIVHYVEMVRDGEDPLREMRLALYQDTFFIPEKGTVGEYIMNHVKIDLEKECRQKIADHYSDDKECETTLPDEIEEAAIDVSEFPLFSILVLCYKNTKLLYGMLDSIFKQDYPRIQLIVSDDSSEDFDVETVQAYIDANKRQNIRQVIVRKNETNMRTVRHIHTALSLAQGEYLVFTAADDRFVEHDVISSYVEEFLLNPESLWIVAKCNVTSPDYKKVIYQIPTTKDDPYFEAGNAQDLFSRWSRRSIALPCCMAFKADALKRVGGIDLEYQFIEDWPVVLKLLRKNEFPVYTKKVIAIHSTGGITNSNNRYGIQIRKAFYDDKIKFFREQVEPYKDLMLSEDRKAYKQYMKEIMARHYFFYIDWPETSTFERLKLCLKSPIRFWWVFEQRYMRIKDKIKRKKMFAVSQGLSLLSLLLFYAEGSEVLEIIFHSMGWIDLTAGIALFATSTLSYPLEKYFGYKARLRAKLVN